MNNIQNTNERNYRIDNIRFILIFLVVFGHLLGIMTGSKADLLYRFIYSFHMPVFIFITGHWITALVQLIQNKTASRKVQCH